MSKRLSGQQPEHDGYGKPAVKKTKANNDVKADPDGSITAIVTANDSSQGKVGQQSNWIPSWWSCLMMPRSSWPLLDATMHRRSKSMPIWRSISSKTSPRGSPSAITRSPRSSKTGRRLAFWRTRSTRNSKRSRPWSLLAIWQRSNRPSCPTFASAVLKNWRSTRSFSSPWPMGSSSSVNWSSTRKKTGHCSNGSSPWWMRQRVRCWSWAKISKPTREPSLKSKRTHDDLESVAGSVAVPKVSPISSSAGINTGVDREDDDVGQTISDELRDIYEMKKLERELHSRKIRLNFDFYRLGHCDIAQCKSCGILIAMNECYCLECESGMWCQRVHFAEEDSGTCKTGGRVAGGDSGRTTNTSSSSLSLITHNTHNANTTLPKTTYSTTMPTLHYYDVFYHLTSKTFLFC